MASPKPKLKVRLSARAIQQLADIWRWNADYYGPSHADAYVDFLRKSIYNLAHHYAQGNSVTSNTEFRYIVIRRKARRHGHIAVYRYDDKAVDVLHVFHTAQDWQSQLAGDPPGE